MTSINLLPWREALRKERQQKYYVALGSAVVLAALIMLLVHSQVAMMIDAQKQRNGFLEGQIAHVEKQIKEIETLEAQKQRLLARMDVIQQLQRGRPQIVHMFDELVNTLPDGVYLTNLRQEKEQLLLEGFAQSNARVSAYMRNLDGSEWFSDPKLDVIQSTGDDPTQLSSKFTLSVRVVNPETESAG